MDDVYLNKLHGTVEKVWLVLSDIHGSWLNLKACEQHFETWLAKAQVSQKKIIVLGDFLDAGPEPAKVWSWIQQNADAIILGNHEDYVFECALGKNLDCYNSSLWKFVPWAVRSCLQNGIDLKIVRQKLCFSYREDSITFVHATEKSNARAPDFFDNPGHDVLLPNESLSTLELNVDQKRLSFLKIKISGHTHYSQHKLLGETLFVNAGSVGYPLFGPISSNHEVAKPTAVYCSIVKFKDGNYDIKWHCVSLNVQDVCKVWMDSTCVLECAPFSLAVIAQVMFGEDVVHEFFHHKPPHFEGKPNGQDLGRFMEKKGLLLRLKTVFENAGYGEKFLQILAQASLHSQKLGLLIFAFFSCFLFFIPEGFSQNSDQKSSPNLSIDSIDDLNKGENEFDSSESHFEEIIEEAVPSQREKPGFGAEPPSQILKIEWVGLGATKQNFAERIVEVAVGDVYSEKLLEKSAQKLRNTRLFSSVAVKIVRLKHKSTNQENIKIFNPRFVKIQFEVVEKWTLIPILRGGFAGGTSFYYMGAYEMNAFGRGVLLGAQYENVFGQSGAVAWYRHPKLFGNGQGSEFEIGLQVKPKFYFIENTLSSSMNITRKFVEVAESFQSIFKRPNLGLQIGLNFSEESYSSIPFKNRYLNEKNKFDFPKANSLLSPQLKLSLGGIAFNEEKVDGFLVEPNVHFFLPLSSRSVTFEKISVSTLFFKNFGTFYVFAFRNFMGIATKELSQRYFSVGGLDGLRGYPDGFVSDKNVLFSNVELRSRFFKSKYVILQNVVFSDVAFATARLSHRAFGPGNKSVYGLSAGGGFRLLVPPIARMNWRADYGFGILPRSFSGLVIGMQQYF